MMPKKKKPKAVNPDESWREKMALSVKSAYKQRALWSLRRQDHALFAEGFSISDNTWLRAQSASLIFKHCPKPEVGALAATLELFPSAYYTVTRTEP